MTRTNWREWPPIQCRYLLSTYRWHVRMLTSSLLLGQFMGLAHANSVDDAATPAFKPSSAIELSPCTLPGVAQVARCGVFDVPENPGRPAGRQLPIHVAVIPATDGQTLPDPIVPLWVVQARTRSARLH